MKRTLILAALAVVVVAAAASRLGGHYGAIANGDRAMQVARQEFSRQGRPFEGPLKVTHANGVWRVLGYDTAGRTGEVYIRDDGRVPSINPRKLKLMPVIANPPAVDEAQQTETN